MTSLPSIPGAAPSTSCGGKTATAVALLLVLAVAATFDTWLEIFRTAIGDEECNHVLLAPAIIAWLAWEKRSRLRGWSPRPDALGPLFVAVGWLCLSLGHRLPLHVARHGGAVLLLLGAAVTVLGRGLLWRLREAALILFFLVPTPWPVRLAIAAPLQRATAHATEAVCLALGMDVARQGSVLTINGADVLIAEACNGMRMVITLFLISYLLAFTTRVRPWARAAILIASPLTAVVANVVRLVPTIWVYGHHSAAAALRFHSIAGWAMLLLPFLLIAAALRAFGVQAGPVADAPPTDFEPEGPWADDEPGAGRRREWLCGLAAAALLTGAGIERWVILRPSVPGDAPAYCQRLREAAAAVPPALEGWKYRDVPVADDVLRLLRADVSISREYVQVATGRHLAVAIVHVTDATQAYHSPTVCYLARGWSCLDSKEVQWQLGPHALGATQYEFTRHASGQVAAICVRNVFLFPDAHSAPDVLGLRGMSADARRYYGATILQVLCDASIPRAEVEPMIEAISTRYMPVIDAALAPVGQAAGR